ncbi:SAM-dependent methyltransferase [Neoroseomonas lacus]|uniref:Cyclopropane-fatty-acyl-phospholipid synthase n=1 Tax=Neoroseomonas lacus TaxID=287609 RepID=A0A917KB14_9PROT|nr:cyclopropane-fatty-acyl-phospholipid synthase family protein [Neoroseomonas lacus]GGJ05990.1 cyclopropane-fatty-acyl-phospholipid synthase [Neoroseomonas lacus]
MKLLSHLLRRFVRRGRLIVLDHTGATHRFGSGEDGPEVTIHLTDKAVEREIFLNPELKTAEAYMDGRLVMEGGAPVFDLLYLFSINRSGLAAHPVQQMLRRAWRSVRRWQQRNPLGLAAKNIRHHYDIPPAFYRLWLDETMTYSCAYYPTPETSLYDAQIAKLRHIAAKLRLEPGMTVAEIGSGWGALGTFLARNYGVTVTSVTLSPEQCAVAKQRAIDEGVTDRVEFREQDYRELEGTYDRVVSIAMMEAIGIDEFDTYFRKIKALTKPGGFALVHCIGRMSPPGTTAPFIRKYIFPGGYVPALSEVFASLERTGTWCDDCESLRLHYYWTIKHWREAYDARRDEAVAMMGDRFCRMWDFYLASVELGFLHGSNFVFQLLLSDRRDDVPVVRDFIQDEERRLAEIGAR